MAIPSDIPARRHAATDRGDGARAGAGGVVIAVLAGGLASRMGRPKGSVPLCGRPLIDYPLAAAHEAGIEAIVVAKRTSELPALAAQTQVIHEPDSPRHPLCGIVAALRHVRSPVLAVGCDMPFVSAALLQLLASARAHGDKSGPPRPVQTTAMRIGGALQPLPALYRPQDTPLLERAMLAGASLRVTLLELEPLVLEEHELRGLGEPRRLCFSVNDSRGLRLAGGLRLCK